MGINNIVHAWITCVTVINAIIDSRIHIDRSTIHDDANDNVADEDNEIMMTMMTIRE